MSDLHECIERALVCLKWDLDDLLGKWSVMTEQEQQALVAICGRIAEMPQHKDAA